MYADSEQISKPEIRDLRRALRHRECYPFRMRLRIKELRKRKGWTVEALADAARLSKSYLSELENHKKVANASRIDAIARALGVSPLELIDDTALPPELMEHIRVLRRLNPADRKSVIRHAMMLDPKSDG